MSESVNFDRAAGFYDETRGFPPGVNALAMRRLAELAGFTPSSKALEIGVGTGRIAIEVSRYVERMIGIDISRAMMDKLRGKAGGDRVCLIQGDATTLPLPSGVFDAVIAVHVFHLIPGWREALNEISRVLGPRGHLIVGFHRHNDSEMGRLWASWRHAVRGKEETVGVNYYDYDTFLTDRGWTLIDTVQHEYCETRRPSMLLQALEERHYSSTWAMTDEDVAKGIAAMREQIEEDFGDPDQELELTSEFVMQSYTPPA